MKNLSTLFFFLALSAFQLVAAQEKLREVEIDGKTYKVYPYKMGTSNSYYNYNGEYNYSYNNNQDKSIVPYPGNLPDGDYIMYYENISKWKKKIWFFHRRGEYIYDTTVVAAKFKIKNNQKEGEATFYNSYINSIAETGMYKNNEREGVWKHYSNKSTQYNYYYLGLKYSEEYSSSYDQVVEEYEYKGGIRNGSYKMYSELKPDIVYATGNYIDNKETGDWKFYYKNKQLSQSYTLTDSIAPVESVPNYFSKNTYYTGYGGSANCHGWMYYYFPNGQLLTRKKYHYGQLERLDTGYFYDGKINWVNALREEGPDTLKKYFCETKVFDSLGVITEHSLTQNGVMVFRIDYDKGEIFTEYYYEPHFTNIKNRDTLVITSRHFYDSDSKEPTQTVYKHLLTGAVLTRDKNKNESYQDEYAGMNDFNFKSDPASDIYYVEELDYKGKNGEFLVHTYSHYRNAPNYYSFYKWYSNELDSVVVTVNGKRFSGDYKERHIRKYKKAGKAKVSSDKITYNVQSYGYRNYYNEGLPSFGYRALKFGYYDPYPRAFLSSIFKRNLQYTVKGNYSNGLKNGVWIDRTRNHGRIYNMANYQNGKLNGTTKDFTLSYADRWSDCKKIYDSKICKKTKINRRGRYYLSLVSNFENGFNNGPEITYHCNGRVAQKINYKNGELDGDWELYDEEGNLTKKAFGLEGYLHGPYKEWGFNRKLRYDCTFEEGAVVGEYKYYFSNGTMQNTGNLMNGYKTGDWYTYFEDGQVKYKESFDIKDSTYFLFTGSQYTSYTRGSRNYLHTLSTCYSMQYYPTGTLAAEGRIERGNRKGLWKFYDEGGNLNKQITYESGKILQLKENGKTDSIYHSGYYESFYPDGKKQSEAYVLYESTKYDCYQAVNISLQDLYYINFWDKEGNQTIKNKTGRLKTYHLTTGKPESEGEMINGKRTGYWRFWDPEGKLNEVGNYENGLRTGKWLMGDLEGMHYLDDACFDMSDPRVLEDMERKKKQLYIHELFYKKGEILKENNYTVNLNKD